ncbi:hypothetical protein H0H81_011540 [Sphagnurus paluster]|uniref:AB hydrolase-1 domain-containing protein n=1 Tax=Sphagnurus paluster TaxID=117069 RepID=A0A9P7FU43_9AGAR|nr:hypothetical protein H0H81_011540 [Sphagnurus paluster]
MPHVQISGSAGERVDLHYTIATPKDYNSPFIAADLPCILFLHSGYAGQEIFENQFSDPRLRSQFNLIGVDMRGYGRTRCRITQHNYGPPDSADDIFRFIKALGLPPVHIFGLAIGGSTGLELATNHPELVLSLTICSPLPAIEPEDIAAGRLEVYHLWVEAFNHDGKGKPLEADQTIIDDLLHGAQQLCFNNETSRLTKALTKLALMQGIENRAGTPTKLKESYYASVGWFLNRRPQSRAALAKIACPIRLIHCEDDVAYDFRHAQELEAQLRHAGVADVELYEVSGPHYGCVINPQAVNPILLDNALNASSSKNAVQDAPSPRHPYSPGEDKHQFHACQRMVTPFTKVLAKFGYDPQENEDESDSDC